MTTQTQSLGSQTASSWLSDPDHLQWLRSDALRQVAFFRQSLRPDGGFDVQDLDGQAMEGAPQELHVTTRHIHSFALAHAAGVPDCAPMIEAGLDYLWTAHRDPQHGGYVWAVARDGSYANDKKLAYGHVFVLLAASSAKSAGFAQADRILDDITGVIRDRYWDDEMGLLSDEFARDWTPFSDYRGYNSNMHGCEAFLGAYEATGDQSFLDMAGRILEFFTGRIAPNHGWRMPEHFTPDWQVDLAYEGDPMFRPRGTTPGHSFELARLALQHWDLAGRPGQNGGQNAGQNAGQDAPDRARKLTETALMDAWVMAGGGFVYTLDYSGDVQVPDRYWWPVTEAIGVLASLIKLGGTDADEAWYRRTWDAAAKLFVDQDRGGWFPEVDTDGQPVAQQFHGKPDMYHAFQADLLPLCPGLSRIVDTLQASKPLA